MDTISSLVAPARRPTHTTSTTASSSTARTALAILRQYFWTRAWETWNPAVVWLTPIIRSSLAYTHARARHPRSISVKSFSCPLIPLQSTCTPSGVLVSIAGISLVCAVTHSNAPGRRKKWWWALQWINWRDHCCNENILGTPSVVVNVLGWCGQQHQWNGVIGCNYHVDIVPDAEQLLSRGTQVRSAYLCFGATWCSFQCTAEPWSTKRSFIAQCLKHKRILASVFHHLQSPIEYNIPVQTTFRLEDSNNYVLEKYFR